MKEYTVKLTIDLKKKQGSKIHIQANRQEERRPKLIKFEMKNRRLLEILVA